MNQNERAFVLLLRSALRDEPPVIDGGVNWPSVCQLAANADTLYAVSSAIKRLAPGQGPDAELAARFEQNANKYLNTYIIQEYEFNSAIQTLQNAGVRCCPTKGLVLRGFYPEAAMRSMCDADIFIHPEDVQKSKDAMIAAGCKFSKDNGTHMVFIMPRGSVVELHEEPLPDYIIHRVTMDELWTHMIPAGECLYALPDEEFYIYLLLHLDKHIHESGFGVRPLMDFWVLRKARGDQLEKSAVCDTLKRIGLYGLARGIRHIEGAWFDGEALPEYLLSTEEWILDGGVYGSETHEVICFLESQAETSKPAVREKIGLRYVLGRIFLPLSHLRAIYPTLAKKPYLYPIYLVKRWMTLAKKRTLIKERLSVLESISPDTVKRQHDVMDALYHSD